MSGRCVAIIQARMGSTRLPGKSMADLAGKPVVERVIERVALASAADAVVVAITDRPEDDVLEEFVSGLGFPVFRGSSDDVLSRYWGAAREAGASSVVRITADCPFADPGVIDAVVSGSSGFDYGSNTLKRSYPLGLDVEWFTVEALGQAHEHAVRQHEREHVTPFIYQHPEKFRLTNVEAPDWACHPEWRLTVDTAEDLEVARHLFERVPQDFRLADVLQEIERDPGVLEINQGVEHRHTEKPGSW